MLKVSQLEETGFTEIPNEQRLQMKLYFDYSVMVTRHQCNCSRRVKKKRKKEKAECNCIHRFSAAGLFGETPRDAQSYFHSVTASDNESHLSVACFISSHTSAEILNRQHERREKKI